jgi:pyruvate,water dikinase
MVTVDAGNRAVYRGRIEELLRETKPKPNPMEGSPVQKTLQAVLAHIAPLHLLDPTAADFQPANCRTLHDITRFCHERSVIEMFAFGDRHHFDQGAAKRIRDNTVTEWWVINLEDGFHPDSMLDGPEITAADIVSRPMLALWEGMHARPWEGPPPCPADHHGHVPGPIGDTRRSRPHPVFPSGAEELFPYFEKLL